MDRLSWYQAGESMEEIQCQSGNVGVYDGELKQSAFEQGTVSLTLQRVIWADSSDPVGGWGFHIKHITIWGERGMLQDCRLVLHHSLIDRIERQHKTFLGRGGKIVASLKPVPRGHPPGPCAFSGFHSIRLVFKNGGEEDFYRRYLDALDRGMWKRTSSSSSSAGSRSGPAQPNSGGGGGGGGGAGGPVSMGPRAVGILGIEKKIAEQNIKAHETISEAFEDMSKLMDQAKEMVTLSKNITERLKSKKGEITDDETIKFKSYLLSLGVSDPVTKASFGTGAAYFEKLAEELTGILLQPLQEAGGTMTLPEAYCRMNRARGVELISPEDLLNACQKLDKVNSLICLCTFESGVTAIQLRSLSPEAVTDEVCKLVESLGSIDASQLSKLTGISLVLAQERLRAAENQSRLCRDDSIEGCYFYPNRFLSAESGSA